jgi:hypothetical protein
MAKYIVILLCCFLYSSDETHTIKSVLYTSSENSYIPSGVVYLLAEESIVDSCKFIHSSNKPYVPFEFKNVNPGRYTLKYPTLYKIDKNFSINLDRNVSDIKLNVDSLPGEYYMAVPMEDLLARKSDTLCLSFHQALGEFGSINQELIVYRNKSDLLTARFVQFHERSNQTPLDRISIIQFTKSARKDSKKLRADWLLSDNEIRYLNRYITELRFFYARGFSNAPDYYVLLTAKEEFVVVDHAGKWNKFVELRKELKLQ